MDPNFVPPSGSMNPNATVALPGGGLLLNISRAEKSQIVIALLHRVRGIKEDPGWAEKPWVVEQITDCKAVIARIWGREPEEVEDA